MRISKSLAAMVIVGAASALAAAELGERVVWNGLDTPSSKWQSAPGISVTSGGTSLIIRSTGADYGWAASEEWIALTASTSLALEVIRVSNGQLNAQLEWAREDGSFIGATNVLQQVKSAARLDKKNLSAFLPQGERPKKFRLKFWLEGKAAQAELTKAVVSFTRGWRKADTRLMKAYDSRSAFSPDAGMKLEAVGDNLVARLEPDTPYSAFTLDDRVAYEPKAVLLADVGTVQNGVVSVQALCWDAENTYLGAVDLLKDVGTSGAFEVPLEMHKEKFPAKTAKLSFKIWLSGSAASTRLAGLYYGGAP